ncbi:MAG: hypothetical protein ACRD32_01080, partial [Nitrososphaerales archaeon]
FPGSSGATVQIRSVETLSRGLHTVHNIDFVGASLPPSTTSFTRSNGAFSSVSELGSPSSSVTVTASFAGNAAYKLSSASDVFAISEIPGGFGVAATILTDSERGIVTTSCSLTAGNPAFDTDGDSLCDNMEGTGATEGVPVVVRNYAVSPATGTTYYYQLPNSSDTVRNIYVESDYMNGHVPNAVAISRVVNAFGSIANPIDLRVETNERMTHQASLGLWRDTDLVNGNDFATLKRAFFGNATEHPILGGTETLAIAPGGSSSSKTVTVSGIQLNATTSPLTSGDTSGRVVIKFNVTLGTSAVVTPGVPTVASPGSGISIGPTAASNVTVTGSGTLRTFEVKIGFSTTDPSGGLVDLGTVSVPYTTSVATTGTPVRTSGSPLLYTSLTDAKAQAYHYIPWIHSIGPCGPSGQAEQPGNDAVIALGCNFNGPAEDTAVYVETVAGRVASRGSEDEQAGTFMHELGHNFGLRHGGPNKLLFAENGNATGTTPTDAGINCKPQYTSVMSYSRQLPTILASGSEWVLNYSSGDHSPLIESALVETSGVSGSLANVTWGTPASLHGHTNHKNSTGIGLDWNDSGLPASGTVGADINNFGFNGCDSDTSGGISTRTSYDWKDWIHLDFNLRKATAGEFDGLIGEPTSQEVRAGYIFGARFGGFALPPPNDDGSSVITKGSNLPLKVRLQDASLQNTLVFPTIRAEFHKVDSPGGYTPIQCTNNANSPDFKFLTAGEFHQCDWKTPKTAGTYYIRVFVQTGLDPPAPLRILLVDTISPIFTFSDPSTIPSGVGGPATNKVRLS